MNPTEKEMTGLAARQLREARGMTQSAFWGPVGVLQSVGARYEQGSAKIPRSVRILLVANYVAGLTVDATTEEAVAGLAKLAAIQASFKEVKSSAASARADLAKASKSIQAASERLAAV